MAIWDEQPPLPVGITYGGGVATDGELYDASLNAMMWVDNVNASELATEEAYDRRIDAIERATGQKLANPARHHGRKALSFLPAAAEYQQALDDWSNATGKLQETRPELANVIKAHVPIDVDARELARAADERLGVLAASRDDAVGSFLPQLAGGFSGSLRDPVQVASLFAGGGVGVGRTAFARVASTAMREAVVNGAVEAAMQPVVQGWRAEIGVENGLDVAARNVLFAAGTAGLIGGAGRAVGEGAASLARRALEGDARAAHEALAPHRDSLPDELRGGLDAMDVDISLQRMERPGIAGDDVLARAIAAAEDPARMADLATPAARMASDDAPVVRAMAADAPDSIHGPLMPRDSYGGDWATLVARMKEQRGGDAPGAIAHPAIGEIDVIWGTADGEGFGLAKIARKHPEVVERLPELVADMAVVRRSDNRIHLESPDHKAQVRLDYDGQAKQWLLTAYEKRRIGDGTTERSPALQVDATLAKASSTTPAGQDIAGNGGKVETGDEVKVGAGGTRGAAAPRQPEDGQGTAGAGNTPQPEKAAGGANLGPETPSPEMLAAQLPVGAKVVRDDGSLVDVRDALTEAGRDDDLAQLIEACKVL